MSGAYFALSFNRERAGWISVFGTHSLHMARSGNYPCRRAFELDQQGMEALRKTKAPVVPT